MSDDKTGECLFGLARSARDRPAYSGGGPASFAPATYRAGGIRTGWGAAGGGTFRLAEPTTTRHPTKRTSIATITIPMISRVATPAPSVDLNAVPKGLAG